jgi:hypothetical protein
MKLDASLRPSTLSVLHLYGMKILRPVDVRRVIRVRISCALRSNILLLMLRLGSATANGSMGLVLPAVCGTLLTASLHTTQKAPGPTVSLGCENLKIYCFEGDHYMHLDPSTGKCKCGGVASSSKAEYFPLPTQIY